MLTSGLESSSNGLRDLGKEDVVDIASSSPTNMGT